jgi:formylglycine-generating enzyme required for sulfatase activity
MSKAKNQFYEEILPPNVRLRMMQIPAGEFLMGSPETEKGHNDSEGPQHLVKVSSFFLGKYPITQAQWQAVAGLPKFEIDLNPDPSFCKGVNRPVEMVSWYDAVEFCARLSQHTQRQYRLPSEAEWEYACRAGTTTPFHFGETLSPKLANYNGRQAYGDEPTSEPRYETTPVDYFKVANAWGLYDMHGNVCEMCQDYWHGDYTSAPDDGSAWLTGHLISLRVTRGGRWLSIPETCRSASRQKLEPDSCGSDLGFRVACSAPEFVDGRWDSTASPAKIKDDTA